MPRAPARRRLTPRPLLLLAALLSFGPGCTEPCRFDADCDSSAGLTRCELETGTCQPLAPMAATTCTEASDCEGGRVCVDGACRFAPSCQRVSEGVSFDYIARCEGDAVVTGSAEASTNGCQVTLLLGDLLGEDARVVLEPISATEGAMVSLNTSASSELSCATGTWSAAESGASLPGCSLPGGTLCDLGLVRAGAGPVCLADGTGCAADETCEPIGSEPNDVGSCR